MTRSIKKRIDLETEAGPASARGLPEPHAQHHVVLQGWQGQAGHGQFALAIIFLEISIDFPHDAVQLSSNVPRNTEGLDPLSKIRPMRFANTPLPGYDPVEVEDLTRSYTTTTGQVISLMIMSNFLRLKSKYRRH